MLIRILIIVGLAIGMVYTYINTDLSITPIMFGVFILIGILEISWHLQKQERNWNNFLRSVEFGDFNRAYQRKTNSKELEEAYELISAQMEALQTNREAEIRLLQTVLRHISVAVVCYRQDGEVVFTNKAFNLLLDLPGMIHIDRLQEPYPQLHAMLAGDSAPAEWIDHDEGQKLLVKTESFKLKGKAHKLASLTDIRSSLDAKELDSYQKLMRVMTHEIMNSTNPVLSLIRVVNKKLIQGDKLLALEAKDQKNVAISLQAIEERTSGMLKFVEAYKQINRPIEPHLEPVESKALLDSITPLIAYELPVDLKVKDEFKDTLIIDRTLMTQVLINLVNNALDAIKEVEKPQLQISIAPFSERVLITVADNGPGVAPKAIQEIFVPFYTTKADGSGIGLALSRKIVKAHGGWLAYSRVDERTRFTIDLAAR